ncbi:putative GTPase activating protein for Arf [Aspergillus ibericus CBS 121593]|uniref:ArfGap-domain-containing protein n=1 Tax=Aspergillus ibericus CBS 121593 TaxID=1448316 RepID=A0A395GNB8_9EURO|nr:ArfGap-domain-containing protein [Aspergillus ibericus CBS 121593]RAK95513.1 ArfGap-domain-containing protein [Aspergillus ibericus CBS 121593]
MVAGISKRQQFRNERALQDLIRSVPGNDRCADCQALNPGWASWNLGIFICMRCASLHRKLGTHISKVKSLSMDTWSDDQVDNMKSHGNNIMNKIYNPRNVKPPVPTDVDESDACMERFIRQKYQHRSLDEKQKPPSRHDSGYDRSLREDRSPEGSPPPLPPKPARPFGFGLRSASSATNLNRMSNRGSAASPQSDTFGSGSPGASVRKASGDASFDSKLAALRDMGFTNERRNAIALRELHGNLDKTIETLVRLGEGNGSVSISKTPAAQPTPDASKSANPFDQLDARPPPQPNANFNPFDAPIQPQLQAQQAPVQSLEQSFQNLQVAQPLFPHSTGGYPMRQASLPQPLYQQAATPPVPANFAQNPYVSSPQPLDGGHNPFFQTGAQPQASLTPPAPNPNPNVAQTNPFFSQVAPQSSAMQPPQTQAPAATSVSPFGPLRHANTMPVMPSTSPFSQPSPFQSQLQAQAQAQAQVQVQPQQQQPQAQPQPQFQMQQTLQQPQGSLNPYQTMTAPATPQHPGYATQPQFGYQASAQYLRSQPTGRVDKNSILSLYQLSPQPPSIPEQSQYQPSMGLNPMAGPTTTQTSQPAPFNTQPQQPSPFTAMPQQQQQAPTDPQAGARNPFFTTQPGAPAPAPAAAAPYRPAAQAPQQPTATYAMPNKPTGGFPRGHMSQQSVDINGFQSGRHSPDAFASLSARYG